METTEMTDTLKSINTTPHLCRSNGALEGINAPRDLRIGHERCRVRFNVRSEGSGESCPVEEEIIVFGRQEP